jgi:hypothetical protein
MIRQLPLYLLIAAIAMISPESARADPGDVITYDTVDAFEVRTGDIVVTGIIVGQSAPSTTSYNIVGFSQDDVTTSRCDRLALLAMSKPGKFRFAVEALDFFVFSCKLIVRTP